MAYDEKARQMSAKKAHSMSLEGRSRLAVSGVEEVESFDEREIVMITSCGSLIIRGEDLSISRLSVDVGDVNVEGNVTSLAYEEVAPSGSLWARLFH